MSFSDIGKKFKDLCNKNYSIGGGFREIKLVCKADNGLTVEANNYNPDSAAQLASSAKLKYKSGDWGEVEGEIHTVSKPSASKAAVTFNKFLPGASLKFSSNAALDLGLEANYSISPVVVKATLSSAGNKTSGSAQIAGSYENVLLGTQIDIDASSEGVSLKDYNFGVQYNYSKDLLIAAKTAKKRSNISLSSWYKYSCCTQVGLGLLADTAKGSNAVTFGLQKALNDNTTAKAKVDSTGKVHGCIEYRTKGLKVNFSSQFAPESSKKNLGYGIVFGDY